MKTIRINTDKQTRVDQYRRFSLANAVGRGYDPLDKILVIRDDTKEEYILIFSQAANCLASCSVRKMFCSSPDFHSICYLTGCDSHTGGGYIEPTELLEDL